MLSRLSSQAASIRFTEATQPLHHEDPLPVPLRLHRHSPTDPLCIFRAQVAARVILLDKAELSLRRGSATFGHSMATVVQLSEGFTRISMIFNGNEDEMKCFLSSPCGNMCQSISVTHRSGNAGGVATTSLHIYICDTSRAQGEPRTSLRVLNPVNPVN